MREPTDNPVPEEVAGEIESLIKGEGPFEEAKEEMLLETEMIEEPEVQDESSDSEMEARISAIEQALLDVPSVPEPILLPDQNVEFGLADAFTTGATVTITPCDMDGNVTGKSDVTIYLKADRTSGDVTIADQAKVTWMRFDERTTSGTVAGVLIGGVLYEDPGTPAGSIWAYGGSTVPSGWLICDGSAISRTTYADLFSAISTLWGIGDGSTTFNVPDLDGRALRGFGTDPFDAVGATGGLTKHDLDHLHTILFVLENGGLGSGSIAFLHTPSVLSSPDWSAAAATYRPDGNHEVDNRGPWACVKYIIRI